LKRIAIILEVLIETFSEIYNIKDDIKKLYIGNTHNIFTIILTHEENYFSILKTIFFCGIISNETFYNDLKNQSNSHSKMHVNILFIQIVYNPQK